MNGTAENSAHESAEAHRSVKLLAYLQKAGIDAVPVPRPGACTGELVLFFTDTSS